MAAIAAALPCQWQASISRSGEHEWLNLRSEPGVGVTPRHAGEHQRARRRRLHPAGARTVTVWQPAAALTGLLGPEPLGEVA